MGTPGTVLDQNQRVDPPEQHRVYVGEVEREKAVRLCGQELARGRFPRREGSAKWWKQ
jgi:hypothetical protein